MKFLKRATPWMVSLTILLVCYIAAYQWLYKPRYGHQSSGSKRPIHIVFRPVTQWDAARAIKQRQREARAFCQGIWHGEGTLRDAQNVLHHVTFQVIIHDDNLTIASADHNTVLVGKTWKIQPFDHNTGMKKNDYAPGTNPELNAFSSPACITSPDHVTLPWFPFYQTAPHVTYITGQRAHLKRVAP